jgi:glutamate N-acetyltransferase/amino-acid N-acetyltransferase
MSTGIIGVHLPMDKIERGIRQAASELDDSPEAFQNAADGMLTTDAGRKVASRSVAGDDREFKLVGMAKGAGMIGPNMATLLCCILTDAFLEPAQAQSLLGQAADRSFNNISVEGHTSTNDTMLLLASGQAGGGPLTAGEQALLAEALTDLSIELAKMIPADGEGARHLIEIRVRGAANQAEARQIAATIAASNLVKTAICGNDPNWGRIVSAAGYAHADVQADRLQLAVNGFKLFEAGEPIPFDAQQVSHSMRDSRTTVIELLVGSGSGDCTHWTSDLTVEYVQFNSEYTT